MNRQEILRVLEYSENELSKINKELLVTLGKKSEKMPDLVNKLMMV